MRVVFDAAQVRSTYWKFAFRKNRREEVRRSYQSFAQSRSHDTNTLSLTAMDLAAAEIQRDKNENELEREREVNIWFSPIDFCVRDAHTICRRFAQFY